MPCKSLTGRDPVTPLLIRSVLQLQSNKHTDLQWKSRSRLQMLCSQTTWFFDTDQSGSRMGSHYHVTLHLRSSTAGEQAVQCAVPHVRTLFISSHSLWDTLLTSGFNTINTKLLHYGFPKIVLVLFEKLELVIFSWNGLVKDSLHQLQCVCWNVVVSSFISLWLFCIYRLLKWC